MNHSLRQNSSVLQAGFAQIDITPRTLPAKTYWNVTEKVYDPLYARAAVFQGTGGTIALLSLDIVIIEREYVAKIRERVSAQCGIPAQAIMVCATHNHACPAVVERPWSAKDNAYLEMLVEWGAQAITEAQSCMVPVEIGTDSCHESRISFNRRFVLRNGTVISQPSFNIVDNDVLFAEAIIDPEVGVLCVRDNNQKIVGILVNFACHPTHLMGEGLSAGFPGALCDRIRQAYGEHVVTLFLNGSCGNVIHNNYADPTHKQDKESVGSCLAENVMRVINRLDFHTDARVSASSSTVKIRYREIEGLEHNLNNLQTYNVFPALIQRGWYSWSLDKLKAMHAQSDHENAELQVFKIGDTVLGAIPAEYFAQDGLRIKEQSPFRNTFVVTLANGWLGYIPNRESFARIGGHESTWCISSKMESAAGDILAGEILKLIQDGETVV